MEPGKTYTLRVATGSLTFACESHEDVQYTGTLTQTIEDVTIQTSGSLACDGYIACALIDAAARFVLGVEETPADTTLRDSAITETRRAAEHVAALNRLELLHSARLERYARGDRACVSCLNWLDPQPSNDWQAFADLRTQLARLHGLDSSASLESIVDELTKIATPLSEHDND